MNCAECNHRPDEHRRAPDGTGYCLHVLTDDESGEPDDPGQSCECPGYEKPCAPAS